MNRRTKYLGQTITAEEWNDSDDQAELADRDMMADMGFFGIVNGLAVAEKSSPTLHVDVATGVAYDQTGRRVRVPGTQDIDLTNDSLGVPTAVTTDGNSKIVSVFVKFKRLDSDPRIATTEPPTTVYWQNAESFEFVVVQGSEAVSPTPPALLADGVLLADVTRTFGQTQILTADINLTGRRQDLVVVTDTPRSLREVSLEAAVASLLAIYNNHVDGTADPHLGAFVNYAGGPTWANGTTNPSTTVELQFDKIISDLADIGADSGAHKIGIAVQPGAPGALPASNLFDRLEALRLAANLSYAGGPQWADATNNPAASVEAQIDKIISDLAAAGTPCGGEKIGMRAFGSFNAGNVAGNFSQLVQTTNGNDGALRIGAQASGGLSVGTVRSQLDELDTKKVAKACVKGGIDIVVSSRSGAAPGNEEAYMILAGTNNTPSSQTVAATASGGYHWLRIISPPHGATLTNVVIRSYGPSGSGGGTLNVPTYQIKRWRQGGVVDDVSAVIDDDHDGANWSSQRDTTVVPSSAHTIDSSYTYAVAVTHPWNASIPASVAIVDMAATYA